MGCMSSKADINDRHPNIFQVVNIDDEGRELRPAKLEITERDIILHQRGRSGVRWPIRCLKRYGFTEGVFSFELGRRCPTGAGVYAFKCERAEALFQLLQTCIQNPSLDEGRHTPAHTADPSFVTGSNGDVAALRDWRGPADGSDQAVYVNEEIWTEDAAAAAPAPAPAIALAPAELELPRQPPVPAQRKTKPTHSYLNTVPCDINTNYQPADQDDQRHLYVNVVPEAAAAAQAVPLHPPPPPPPPAAAAASGGGMTPTVALLAPGVSAEDDERCYVNIAARVNYAVLDLQQPGAGSRLEPPSVAAPGRPSQGYATIDFDKTAALSMAVSRVDTDAELECRRKTRHNSTIAEPNLSRHNSVIST
ncbi:fibroblast growth factor receptor substrate 3-like [Amphibalanus amphitrite]|uniref:fibroblast growth factor receptor substrate 3-like n=1 Tax=Amphibalanus amphitrite TaxID=1232801 RepID=UPI001C92645E|nr:fibroblast growth factor receptor substrate 3-like [Amphibalanus amphitrite]XP_043247164.1 fibroblast growth factor receptor substrate 3-like [Amphibalanus amphitrite]XP_043247173.1 fibroblast growth factor receptor substrate 3-like [Amphibalanus amphitrite]